MSKTVQAKEALLALKKRTDLGFLKSLERPQQWQSSRLRAQHITKQFSHTVICGMGGSVLPGETLNSINPSTKVSFISNIDDTSFWKAINSLKLPETHFVFVSKSGTTLETLAMAEFIAQALDDRNLKVENQSTVISELKSNPLSNWAREKNITLLEIPEDLGGRFSAFSPVGYLPAYIAGVDMENFLEGARVAFEDESLLTDMMVQSLEGIERQDNITSFWFYSSRLEKFGLWLEQLWSESLGKSKDRSGALAPKASRPQICFGATDQHSLLQQLAEGPRDTNVMIFRFEDAEHTSLKLKKNSIQSLLNLKNKSIGEIMAIQAEATTQALAQFQIPYATYTSPAWDAYNAGKLMMGFQLLIGGLGEALNIDAYNQPGVELSKKLAKSML